MSPVTTRRRKQAQSQAKEDATKPTEDSSLGTSLPVRPKDGEDGEEETDALVASKGNLTVFDDEDEGDEIAQPSLSEKVSKDPITKKVDEVEPEEDSDDDAPEAVSTSKAAVDVKKTAQAAQRAAKEQAAAQKRKRQQRDELFKLQAEERKKVEDEAKAAEAELAARAQLAGGEAAEAKQTESGGRRRVSKRQVPALLPIEFLTDSSSEDDDDDSAGGHVRSKKRRVSAVENKISRRQNQAPKDQIVGSTVYRVAKKPDETMAPKLKKYTKSTKDILLKRNRSAIQSKSSFLKRK